MSRRVPLTALLLVVAGCASIAPTRSAQAPVADAAGARPYHFLGDITVAAGHYEHDTKGDGGLSSEDADGGFSRLLAEGLTDSGLGGGLSLEGAASDDDIFADVDGGGFGFRAEVEPEYWFVVQDGFSFGIVGAVSAGAHATSIDVDAAGLSDDFDGTGVTS